MVRRGYDELYEIPAEVLKEESKPVDQALVPLEGPLPIMLKKQPVSQAPGTDIHRFWEQTGNFYMRGMGNDIITDPFVGLSWMPAITSVIRDMTGIRMEHPEWIPENCTACGNCWTVCPDTAIPGLVSEVSSVFDTVVDRVKKNGNAIKHLPKALRIMEGKLRNLVEANTNGSNPEVAKLMDEAINVTLREGGFEGEEKTELSKEFDLFKKEFGDFQFAITRPYYTIHEKEAKGSGGLLSITVNPYTCKGCNECVTVCDDDALRTVTQTEESVKKMKDKWGFWLDLPTTPQKFIRVDNLEEKIGALDTILLDKEVYNSVASGDGACLGCSQKSVIHIFCATVEALMQPRVKKHIEYLEDLIGRVEKHIQMKLVENMDVGDAGAMGKVMEDLKDTELTLAGVAAKLEGMKGTNPIDPEWFKRVTGLLTKLKDLRWKYTEGTTGKGRSSMGMINATGCTSVWGSTYPFNPYPFPWANHLFQDSASMAMGVFEGHMSKMADGFRAIRLAELELDGKYDPATHDRVLHLLQVAGLHRRRVAALPAGRRHGR